jgi:putative ABC transport system permease protein
MVDLALKSLVHDKLRFVITVAGVAFAVTLVFVQVGLFLGLLDNASVTIEHANADLWVTSRNTPNIDFSHTFTETRVDRVRSIPGVARADNLIIWFMQVNLPSGAQEGTEAYGLEDFSAWNIPWKVTDGNVDDLHRGDYMMVDQSAVKRWGTFQVGDYREVLGRRLEIIGRTKEALSFTTTPIAFIDYRLVQQISPDLLRGSTTYILVKLAPGADTNAVRAEIAHRLPYNDVYTKAEWAARSREYWVKSTGIGLNMYITVFLGCLVGVVVVAQTLYTSAMEHIREFGTVKAIGGNNGDIYMILGKQATIAAIVGFALGLVQSLPLRPVMANIGLKLIIPNIMLGWVFAGTVVLCLTAALVAFRKVASIDPALVFRT